MYAMSVLTVSKTVIVVSCVVCLWWWLCIICVSVDGSQCHLFLYGILLDSWYVTVVIIMCTFCGDELHQEEMEMTLNVLYNVLVETMHRNGSSLLTLW